MRWSESAWLRASTCCRACARVYRWQGAVERADEVMLVIKTRAERLPALSARIRSLHPHELPEVLAVAITDGLPAYLQWIVAETALESE